MMSHHGRAFAFLQQTRGCAVQVATQRRAILILDDPNVASALRGLIDTWVSDTHDILTATSVEEAMAHLAAHAPELVITDYAIPRQLGAKVQSGLDFAQYIKRTNRETRVILLTTHSHVGIDFDEVERWVDVYLLKPFILRELQDAVIAGLAR
jgi:DNA-binding NtrC family response regulator